MLVAACSFDSSGGGAGSEASTGGSTTSTDETFPMTTIDPATSSVPATASTTVLETTGTTSTPATTGSTTGAVGCPNDWWDESWARRVRVRIDNGDGTQSLSDFAVPVRLDLGAPELAGYRGDGTDFRFVDDEGNELSHELEQLTRSRLASVWVLLPTLESGNESQELWLYLGNPGARATNAASDVWGGHAGVWHLSDDRGGAARSSAATEIAGLSSGTSATQGIFGNALEFVAANNSNIDFGAASEPLFRAWDEFSLSLWLYPTAPAPDLGVYAAFSRGPSLHNGRMWHETWQDPDVGLFQIDIQLPTGHSFFRRFSVRHAQWNHLVYDYDGQTLRLVHDGVVVQEETALAPSALYDQGHAMVLGGGYAFDVVLDELRISSQSRPPAWYEAQHRMLTQPLVTLGFAQQCG